MNNKIASVYEGIEPSKALIESTLGAMKAASAPKQRRPLRIRRLASAVCAAACAALILAALPIAPSGGGELGSVGLYSLAEDTAAVTFASRSAEYAQDVFTESHRAALAARAEGCGSGANALRGRFTVLKTELWLPASQDGSPIALITLRAEKGVETVLGGMSIRSGDELTAAIYLSSAAEELPFAVGLQYDVSLFTDKELSPGDDVARAAGLRNCWGVFGLDSVE